MDKKKWKGIEGKAHDAQGDWHSIMKHLIWAAKGAHIDFFFFLRVFFYRDSNRVSILLGGQCGGGKRIALSAWKIAAYLALTRGLDTLKFWEGPFQVCRGKMDALGVFRNYLNPCMLLSVFSFVHCERQIQILAITFGAITFKLRAKNMEQFRNTSICRS